MTTAAPVSLHAVVPVSVLAEVDGGPRCQSPVRQAGGPHLHLTTTEQTWLDGAWAVNVSQDDPRLRGTLEVWL